MIAPRVHLNGDTKQELQSKLAEAGHAILEAQRALRETAPNGRNYYVISPEAFNQAREEYQGRQERLQSVYNEVVAIFNAIEDGRIETEEEVAPK